MVDLDFVAIVIVSPMAAVGDPAADGPAGPEGNDGGGRDLLPDDDDLGVVGGHVDDLWVGLDDRDDFFLLGDRDLVVGEEVPRIGGLGSEALDGGHYVLLLGDDGIAEGRGPVEIVVHLLDDVGVVHEGQNTGVEVELLDGIFVDLPAVLVQEPSGLDDLDGVRRRGEDVAEQVVGIEGDWPDQVVQLRRRELLDLLVHRRAGDTFLRL